MITRAPFNTLENGDMAPTDATQRAYAAACSDLKSALATWTSIVACRSPASTPRSRSTA